MKQYRILINGKPFTVWRNCSDVTVKQMEHLAEILNGEVKNKNIADWDIEYRGVIKMFKLESLPKDVKEKIYNIDFTPDEENVMGFVNLKDGWVFDWDGSHVEGFESRKDLIDIVRNSTIQESEVK